MHMHKDHRCWWSKIGWILVLIGGLDWGLIGLGYFFGGNWNVVNLIFGRLMWLEAVIYLLVGTSAVVMLFGCRCGKCKEGCEKCGGDSPSGAPMPGQQM